MPIHSTTSETFYAEGYSEVVIDLIAIDSVNPSRIGGMVLQKVWYTPSLTYSLISIK
jgi:hypothetical protein